MGNLSKIAQNRFLVIGRAGMDFYPDPPGTSIEDAERFVSALGGSSANIAAAITRHGGEADILTSVSDDAVGRFALKQLAAYGIGTRHVTAVGGEFRNSLAVSESRLEGHQTVIYRNGAADFQMTPEHVSSVDYSAYGGVITTGTVLASQPSRDAAFHAFDLATNAGLPLIFDVDYRPYSWASAEEAAEVYSRAAGFCDIIIGNDDEFGFMAGDYAGGLEKARNLAANGAAIVIYKMGPKGSVTITADDEFNTGIFAVDALKPVGAGDAFMGGLVASLAAGYSLPDCVRRGSACAAIVVTRVGCAPAMPAPDELETFMAAHGGPTPS